MPTVSVYIKNEDWEKWSALEKPSEFIHNALNPELDSMIGSTQAHIEKYGGVPDISKGKPIKTPEQFDSLVQHLKTEGGTLPTRLCKHGYDPKLCKFAKPGKPCK